MCQQSCCAPFWAITICIMQVIALACPWYMIVQHSPMVDCDVTTTLGWSHLHSDYGSCSGVTTGDVDLNWRDFCDLTEKYTTDKDMSCDAMKSTMDTSAAFASLSLIVAVATTIMTFIHHCRGRQPNAVATSCMSTANGPSNVIRGFLWAGAVLSFIACVTFSATFTHSYKKMNGSCDKYHSDLYSPSCPSSSLIGVNSYDQYHSTPSVGKDDTAATGDPVPVVWMPFGYWAQLFTMCCYLFAICAWHSLRNTNQVSVHTTHIATQQPQQQQPQQIYNLQQHPQSVPYGQGQPQQQYAAPMQQPVYQQPQQPVYQQPQQQQQQQPMYAQPQQVEGSLYPNTHI